MSITASGEAKPDNLMPGKARKCAVCGYIARGDGSPTECLQCAGTGREFIEFTEKKTLPTSISHRSPRTRSLSVPTTKIISRG